MFLDVALVVCIWVLVIPMVVGMITLGKAMQNGNTLAWIAAIAISFVWIAIALNVDKIVAIMLDAIQRYIGVI